MFCEKGVFKNFTIITEKNLCKINMLKNMKVLLCTYFHNISLNVVTPNFFNIYNLSFSLFLNIAKIRVKFGPKTNYFSSFMGSCTNRIADFNNLSALIWSQQNDLVITVFMQTTLKLVQLLQ